MICLENQPGRLCVLDVPCEIRELVANTSSTTSLHQDFNPGLCLVKLVETSWLSFLCDIRDILCRFMAAKSRIINWVTHDYINCTRVPLYFLLYSLTMQTIPFIFIP